MGKGYKHGGSGGAALNFNIKTYPSETELKADKTKENTIGVITTTTMTSWVFSAKELTEPEVGMLWLSLGNSSPVEFNALKNNTLHVYPISAKQYEGGKWVDKVAYSYQNGAWVEWVTYLYNKGNLCEELTGGWSLQKNGSASNASAPTITYNDDSVTITHSSSDDVSRNWITNNTIDLTKAKTVIVNVTGLSGSVYSDIRIRAKSDGIVSDKHAVLKTTTVGKNEVDVSALSGEYYIAVYSYSGSGSSGYVTISEVYFA